MMYRVLEYNPNYVSNRVSDYNSPYPTPSEDKSNQLNEQELYIQ